MLEYLLICLIALGVVYLLAAPARISAIKFSALAPVRDRDVHAEPVPYFGGLAILGGLLAALLAARELPVLANSAYSSLILHDTRAVMAGACVICAVGIMDDIHPLGPLVKLVGQVMAASVTVALGVQITYIPYPGNGGISTLSLDGSSQSQVLTVLILVTCANAVNFLDGLDGLAAGVVAIGASAFFSYSYLLVYFNGVPNAATSALLTVALVGSCLGFLAHNFSPAQIFMGDAGSLLIGYVLACSTITLSGQFPSSRLDQGFQGSPVSLMPAMLPLILPFAVLLIPLLDLALAVLRRGHKGLSFFAPDKLHLHHRLLEIGHTQRRAVIIIYCWTTLVAYGLVVISLTSTRWSLAVLVIAACLTLVLTVGPRGRMKWAITPRGR